MDIEQIGAIVGLATSAVGLTDQAANTAGAIKKLFASDKTPDKDETVQLLNNLAGQLTAANMMNVQLSEALRALSAELRKQDEFEKEKARYELIETSQNVPVFRLKEEEANGQPIHFICPVCLNRDKLISYITGENDFKECQTNREHVYRFKNTPIRHPEVHNSRTRI